MAVHPRQQTAIRQTQPFIVAQLFEAEGMDYLLDGRRRMLRQERDFLVHLKDTAQDRHPIVGLHIVFANREIGAETVDIALRM